MYPCGFEGTLASVPLSVVVCPAIVTSPNLTRTVANLKQLLLRVFAAVSWSRTLSSLVTRILVNLKELMLRLLFSLSRTLSLLPT